MALNQDDIFLVNRGETSYRINFSDLVEGVFADVSQLVDAPDDVLAAEAGVAVNQVYRSGNTLKVRLV